jgi:hypothetical protein
VLKQYFAEETRAGDRLLQFEAQRRTPVPGAKGVVNSLEYIHGGLEQDRSSSPPKKGKIQVMVPPMSQGAAWIFPGVCYLQL